MIDLTASSTVLLCFLLCFCVLLCLCLLVRSLLLSVSLYSALILLVLILWVTVATPLLAFVVSCFCIYLWMINAHAQYLAVQ
uniref:Probable protein E5 n=1 Tax=Human papillomavirus 35 TaxID=10587 RepID=VE5_HPV35|nr:RecName: Full=Probable protein E5 [human papillomavirus 35]AAA46970.1 E5 [human papillomavirus 35]